MVDEKRALVTDEMVDRSHEALGPIRKYYVSKDEVRTILNVAFSAAALNKCDDCGGSGLRLNVAGEPDICGTCKGNTVIQAAALAKPS